MDGPKEPDDRDAVEFGRPVHPSPPSQQHEEEEDIEMELGQNEPERDP
jgi:hypothetical protein